MKQLTLFDNPASTAEEPKESPVNTVPEKDGEYQKILGARYSLTKVKGWVEIYALEVYRPPHHHGLLPFKQSAWVDPETIDCIYKSNDVSWGFGPTHELGNGNYESVSFYLRNQEEYDAVHNQVMFRKFPNQWDPKRQGVVLWK